ncbi:hypothetical protein LMG31886_08530 [Xanthomonas hydrangeae]|uniref:hypothetical protein n=1 Tax=Xanthomonas hydrangeae TaxID=2775159 RepID=UPI001965A698|nr:hypothetical protein LMG31884_08630 [Xanthomonas hydrangeae]CAD7713942.1 hypothetical protein LMG31884_08630 [Xanthomonas hydrangeae]CAD7721797.1 hypothetical protein LMG31887_08640 [Xanthomonas hydrangeae]CAD7721801.1 hypothetical protein LMG31887_08640 [Xanthomonas hydrangeae]CAD7724254.1 hypothetical protein LMG31885_06970 [Xanthomonas hydrangeae]
MVQTRPSFAVTVALLAALSLAGCASLCGAPGGAPPPERGHHGPPPPRDPEFDAALQACATAQDIALPVPDAPPPGPLPSSLLQCLEAEGFEPPPRHG